MAERVLCFGSAATAAEFFSLEKEREKKKKEEEPRQRVSVFERLGPIPCREGRPEQRPRPRRNHRSGGDVYVPEWKTYALMGDSIMVRLAKALDVSVQNSPVCRGGLTALNLSNVVRKMPSTPKKIILLIGVNDVMQGISKDAIIQLLEDIVGSLQSKGTSKIIIMELLPILNLRSVQIQRKVSEVNEAIRGFESESVTALPVHHLFIRGNRSQPDPTLYERKSSGNGWEVHPGRGGIRLILDILKLYCS